MKITGDDLIHHRVPQGLFVVKVVVQSAFGDARGGQNGIQVRAPKAGAVDLLEGSLQQKPSRALRIPRRCFPGWRSLFNPGKTNKDARSRGRCRAKRFHALPGLAHSTLLVSEVEKKVRAANGDLSYFFSDI